MASPSSLLDLPGFGASEEPPIPWSAGDYARFVSAFLNSLSISGCHFVGHSFGGSVGIVLAAERAAQIKRMALLNSAGVRRPPAWPLRWRAKTIRAARAGLRRLGFSDTALRLGEWSAARFGSDDYRAAQGVMRSTLVRVLSEDLTAQAARVLVPTLLLWGELDEATPRWQGELLARTIPDAGLHVFPRRGALRFPSNGHPKRTISCATSLAMRDERLVGAGLACLGVGRGLALPAIGAFLTAGDLFESAFPARYLA